MYVTFVGISMTQLYEILIIVLHPELHLKIYRKIGFAQLAV